jgi:hypothetical protein
MDIACSTPTPTVDAADASEAAVIDASFEEHSDGATAVGVDALVRACAVLVSCPDAPDGATSIADCVQTLRYYADPALDAINPAVRLDLDRRVQCALAASDCRGFSQCSTLGHGPLFCAQHSGTICDGDVLVSCATPATATWATGALDCAALGQVCREAFGRGACTTGISCATNYQRCEGTRKVTCSTGRFEQSVDCAAWPGGASCALASVDGGTARASCVATAGARPACTTMSALSRCDGSLAVRCIEPGLPMLVVDCAQYGARCVSRDGGLASCEVDSSECSEGTPDRCEGATLATCIDGRWRRLPCASVWRSQCVLTAGAARCAD